MGKTLPPLLSHQVNVDESVSLNTEWKVEVSFVRTSWPNEWVSWLVSSVLCRFGLATHIRIGR